MNTLIDNDDSDDVEYGISSVPTLFAKIKEFLRHRNKLLVRNRFLIHQYTIQKFISIKHTWIATLICFKKEGKTIILVVR